MPTKNKAPEIEIRPQPGMQEAFLSSPADIVLGGGKAGSGKTFALLMEPLRHTKNPKFSAVIFRRTYPQITNEGGLWDTSAELYPALKATPRASDMEWKFKSGATVRFCHLQHDDDRFQWDGAQVPLIAFDQAEHFSAKQFWYLFSRNRSTCGVRPYMRLTANPPEYTDPPHWLRALIDWWIDPETGIPVESRSGVIRWFVRVGEEIAWADSREELLSEHGPKVRPKSFTFIRGQLEENLALMKKDPGYLANLMAMPKVDRERLLYGNWNARETAGSFFDSTWFEVVAAAPGGLVDEIRYWDRAGSAPGSQGSWTAGVRMGKAANGLYYVIDVQRFQGTPLTVMKNIRNIATQDGPKVRIGLEQDPAQAGKAEAEAQVRNLAGYMAQVNVVHEKKGVRARPFSAQAEAGNIKLVRGAWNPVYLNELQNFDGSDACTSDQVDASSGAFLLLTKIRHVGVWGGDNAG